MAWASPHYTKSQVNRAGEVLISPSPESADLDHALAVINNWRSSHSFPLNTFQLTLRKKAREVDSDALIAQRLKRLSSIALKLRLQPNMALSTMQDIGGCRAVVGSVSEVTQLVKSYEGSDLKHKLVRVVDYIREPRESGYRSVHLIYRYFSDRKPTYNGLQIEMQIRSQLQHAWATAVETVGTLRQQALKSSLGDADWLRFFALMGTAIALRERTAPVPSTPRARSELVPELRDLATRLDVEGHLTAMGVVLRHLTTPATPNARYFLLELDPGARSVNIAEYETKDLPKASAEYLETERRIAGRPGADAVLVSVDSLAALQRAYPNYFLDTKLFIEAVKKAIA